MTYSRWSTVRRLGRSLSKEIFGFRAHYALHVDPNAGGKGSLDYYIFSDRLFLEDQIFDANGIPRKQYRLLGPQYNPLFVAWWGLVNLGRHLRGDGQAMSRFLAQVEWLKASAVERDDGAVVWPCNFDWQEGLSRLRAPWISAMYQGVVISALIRAYRLTCDERLLVLCQRASLVFGESIEDGGVRTLEDGAVLYEEYPAYPLPRILDGFLFSLLGLYDLAVETDCPGAFDLFSEGVEGLRRTISFWDYRHKWSWYGTHGYLCPPHYHALNRALLLVLASLTRDRVLEEQSHMWSTEQLPWADLIEIFTVFVTTKSWARLHLPNELGG